MCSGDSAPNKTTTPIATNAATPANISNHPLQYNELIGGRVVRNINTTTIGQQKASKLDSIAAFGSYCMGNDHNISTTLQYATLTP